MSSAVLTGRRSEGRLVGLVESMEAQRPLMVWALLLGLAFTVFSGHNRDLGLPIGPERILIPLALLLAALDPIRRVGWSGIHVLMLLLVAWTLVSMVLSGSMSDSYARFALLDRLVLPFLLFTLGPIILATPDARRLLLRLLALLGLWLGLTAIFTILGPQSLVWPRYIIESMPTDQTPRAYGPFGAAEANGLTISMGAFAAGALLMDKTERWPWHVLSALTLPVAVLGAGLTMTRSIWLGLILGAVAMGLLLPPLRKPLAIGAAACAMGITAVLAMLPSLFEDVVERASMSTSLFDRANTNAAAMRIMEAHPWTGIGWARFLDNGWRWVRQDPDYPLTNVHIEVHDVFLARGAELGVPAALVFILILALGPGRSLVCGRPCVGAAFHAFFAATFAAWMVPTLLSPNPYPLPNYLFWLVAGVCGSLWLSSSAGAAKEGSITSRRSHGKPFSWA